LTGTGDRHHTSSDVHADSRDIVPATIDVADMNPDSHCESVGGELIAYAFGDADSRTRRRKKREHAVARRLYD
jgi:hypothetical protein